MYTNMKKFLRNIVLYFSNLCNYDWADNNNRRVYIKETSWFCEFSIYPLVSYYYIDDATNNKNQLTNLHLVSRTEFISLMHTI